MLKTESKRRRTKLEIEEAKLVELARDNAMRTQQARVDELEAQLRVATEQARLGKNAAHLMGDLINAGVVE